MSDMDRGQLRSFTGDKLDWLSALSADPRLDARAFEVGFQIAQHLNAQNGVAILSDDTISDKTGIPKRWVLRARNALRSCGWIDWRRTKTANVYWTRGEQINQVIDHQILLKELRQERRLKRKAPQETPPVAHLKMSNTPRVANLEPPPVANAESPPVANIHLSSYTFGLTPSKISPPVEDSLLSIEDELAAEAWLLAELGAGDAALGNLIADEIGKHRFLSLLGALTTGTLHRSQIYAASESAMATRGTVHAT
ncbi:hypothetical protein [Bradyrhizobium sp. WSM1417]|uniref:hypothetical protein n=1 Tax=Bradyrhizobium sp. WSM1417 TaxID=754500 RepID=UPI0004808DB1|nr:hypothetical protein [Bradyrhizobium sp. WSM1417]